MEWLKRIVAVLMIVSLVVCSIGCISLSHAEKDKLQELKAQGIQIKHPGLASTLNIMPGWGNFYLAYGTNEYKQWLMGIVIFLTWPLSLFWAIQGAAIDANNINKRETVYYYTYGSGADELDKK